jgi:hypothetical protein
VIQSSQQPFPVSRERLQAPPQPLQAPGSESELLRSPLQARGSDCGIRGETSKLREPLQISWSHSKLMAKAENLMTKTYKFTAEV